MSQEILSIHNEILRRLVDQAHVSEDERRDMIAYVNDVHEAIHSGKTIENPEVARRNAKRAELQAALAALDN